MKICEIPTEVMTEKELKLEADQLQDIMGRGDGTLKQADRLDEIRRVLRRIRSVRNPATED